MASTKERPLSKVSVENNYKRLVAMKKLLDSEKITKSFDIKNRIGGASYFHHFVRKHGIVRKVKLEEGGWKYAWNDSIPITMVLATRISTLVKDKKKSFSKSPSVAKKSKRTVKTNTASRNIERMKKIKELLTGREDVTFKIMMKEVGGAAQFYMAMNKEGVLQKIKGERGRIFYRWNNNHTISKELAEQITKVQQRISLRQEVAKKQGIKKSDSKDDTPPINTPSKKDTEKVLKDGKTKNSRRINQNLIDKNLERLQIVYEFLKWHKEINYSDLVKEAGGASYLYRAMVEEGVLNKVKGKGGKVYYVWNDAHTPSMELAVILTEKARSFYLDTNEEAKKDKKKLVTKDGVFYLEEPVIEHIKSLDTKMDDLKNKNAVLLSTVGDEKDVVAIELGSEVYYVNKAVSLFIVGLKTQLERYKSLIYQEKGVEFVPPTPEIKEEPKFKSKEHDRYAEFNKDLIEYLNNQNELSERNKKIVDIITSEPVIRQLADIIQKSYLRSREGTPKKKREISILWGAFRRTLKF